MIYQYQCAKCGEYEIDQRMTDSALKKCPTCGSKTERIITGGSGFFFDDDTKKRGYKGTSKAKGSRNYGNEKPHGLSQDWIANHT